MTDKRRSRRDSAVSTRPLRRDSDGSLYDLTHHRPVTIEELRDDLRSGRHFRAHRHDTGADCTYEVLVEVLTAALPTWSLPAKGNLETALGTLWKGVCDVLDERPKHGWDKGWHRKAEQTPKT
jgi:hypothetical protein